MLKQISTNLGSVGFHWRRVTSLVLAASLTWAPAFAPTALAQDSYLPREEVQTYIEELVAEHGFSRLALEQVFSQAQKQDRIIELMSRPAERRLVWHEYRKILVDEPRISQGVTFWQENLAALQRAEQEYGVAPEVIV